MSDYKAPEPELHIPDPDLDLKTYDEAWTVLKHCDTCDNMISLPNRPPPDEWPDFCRDCTDYGGCDCPNEPYPVRQSWKTGVMPEFFGEYGRYGYKYGSDSYAFVCEC